MKITSLAVGLTLLGSALGVSSSLAAELPAGHPVVNKLSAEDQQFFETKIRPILTETCYKCHSKDSDKVRGGLLLDTREAMLHGGNTGPAIVPGKPDESLLIQAIRYKDEDLQMPPKGQKLSDQQIADLTEWVRRGAPDPRSNAGKTASGASYGGGVGKNHWAFQPVKKPAVPAVQNAAWVKNPIDNFVLAKLEANGMAPNAPAERANLIRRVYFDLVGMPPTVAEVQAFVNDKSPDAFAKVVDRLLDSQQYGEHWARYWLDVARYSDTKGDPPRQDDPRIPHAWTYRDWVIDAFNTDLPYDKFVYAQIAGDRLQAVLEKRAADKKLPAPDRSTLAAMGFLTLGNTFDGRRDDVIGDQIDVTTKAFLGLTVACARCHDHKFDPIPTKDYYSLYGVFANSVQPKELPTIKTDVAQSSDLLDYFAKRAEFDKREAELEDFRKEIRRQGNNGGKKAIAANKAAMTTKAGASTAMAGDSMMAGGDAMMAGGNSMAGSSMAGDSMAANAKKQPERNPRQELQRMERTFHKDRTDLEINHAGSAPRANVLVDVPRSKDYPVLLRGEVANKGEIVPRRFLEILSPDPKNRKPWTAGSGRAELAAAIADPKNPLTARVFVNRMWQQHWGEGFVSTPDDLGNMSSPPTHPELLDWLSATFVENKWSIKALHRMIVLSASYQQSSANNPAYAEKDPNNKLLWRYNLRRMDFEELHDALLAITGELDLTYGGKPVPIASVDFAKRRAIYTLIDRRNPPELLTQFDFPNPDVASGRRYETLVPQQALFLMNSPMVIETARKLVEKPGFAEFKTDEERVAALYLAIYQRMPTKKEVEIGVRYVKANPQGTSLDMPEPGVMAQKNQQTPKELRKEARQAQNPKQQGRFSGQVGGVYEKMIPLNAWTKLAHALFQSNEAMFYN